MYYPDLQEFKKLSKKGDLIPVYKELLADLETPVTAFLKVDKGDYSYLLESVEGQEKIGRYSFLGTNPSLIFKSKADRIELFRRKANKLTKVKFKTQIKPLDELKKIISNYKFVSVRGLPRFCGGFVGYIGYDYVRFFENIPDTNPDDLNLADIIFVLTDTILIFDHIAHKIKIVSNVHIEHSAKENLDQVYHKAVKKIEHLAALLRKPLNLRVKRKFAGDLKVESNVSKQEFKHAVAQAKEYIKAGDIIQAVISQRLKVKVDVQAFDLYRALRIVNPSPYMYYLNFKGLKLIGSSPEVMVRCEQGIAEVRPIAGTRKRGKNARDDEALSEELKKDSKEIAEHIMLLDLGRNDLGRVCAYGTVKVTELMRVEKYSHVMHLVSDVQGIMRKGKDIFALIAAGFPAGTVSGAPKIRAMEIIDELENVKRGPYAGCVGYLSFSGNIDTCITIRTIVLKGKYAYIQAGAGIVADSVPEREYQETLNKAKALLQAIKFARQRLL